MPTLPILIKQQKQPNQKNTLLVLVPVHQNMQYVKYEMPEDRKNSMSDLLLAKVI